jgi:hypothetical protein
VTYLTRKAKSSLLPIPAPAVTRLKLCAADIAAAPAESLQNNMAAAHPTGPLGKVVTATETKRVIYFRGHKDASSSALICQLGAGYETLSKLLDDREGATRTLLNCYNLHACRGPIDPATGMIR